MLLWIFWKISIMSTVRQNNLLSRKILIVGIPNSTVLVTIFRVFMWPLSLINVGSRSITHLKYFKMVSKKSRDHMLQAIWTMELLRRLLILQWHTREKISVPRLKSKRKCIIYLLKKRTMHCLRMGFKNCFFTKAIKYHAQLWSGSFLSFFWSGLRGPKAYSLWGGVFPSPSIGYDYL